MPDNRKNPWPVRPSQEVERLAIELGIKEGERSEWINNALLACGEDAAILILEARITETRASLEKLEAQRLAVKRRSIKSD